MQCPNFEEISRQIEKLISSVPCESELTDKEKIHLLTLANNNKYAKKSAMNWNAMFDCKKPTDFLEGELAASVIKICSRQNINSPEYDDTISIAYVVYGSSIHGLLDDIVLL